MEAQRIQADFTFWAEDDFKWLNHLCVVGLSRGLGTDSTNRTNLIRQAEKRIQLLRDFKSQSLPLYRSAAMGCPDYEPMVLKLQDRCTFALKSMEKRKDRLTVAQEAFTMYKVDAEKRHLGRIDLRNLHHVMRHMSKDDGEDTDEEPEDVRFDDGPYCFRCGVKGHFAKMCVQPPILKSITREDYFSKNPEKVVTEKQRRKQKRHLERQAGAMAMAPQLVFETENFIQL